MILEFVNDWKLWSAGWQSPYIRLTVVVLDISIFGLWIGRLSTGIVLCGVGIRAIYGPLALAQRQVDKLRCPVVPWQYDALEYHDELREVDGDNKDRPR